MISKQPDAELSRLKKSRNNLRSFLVLSLIQPELVECSPISVMN